MKKPGQQLINWCLGTDVTHYQEVVCYLILLACRYSLKVSHRLLFHGRNFGVWYQNLLWEKKEQEDITYLAEMGIQCRSLDIQKNSVFAHNLWILKSWRCAPCCSDVKHWYSSESSPQSLNPLHVRDISIHFWLLQRNSWAKHPFRSIKIFGR